MALSRDKKQQVVAEVSEILANSKTVVLARYSGTPVSALQQLRREAKGSGTTVRIIKNRLFAKAMASDEKFKTLSSDGLKGQLLFSFNRDDELAPAQVLADFAKAQPQIEFVGALTSDGQWLGHEEVRQLASLPSKGQLNQQVVASLAAPLTSFMGLLSTNVQSLVNVLSARQETITKQSIKVRS